jgi:hypothetical protein
VYVRLLMEGEVKGRKSKTLVQAPIEGGVGSHTTRTKASSPVRTKHNISMSIMPSHTRSSLSLSFN